MKRLLFALLAALSLAAVPVERLGNILKLNQNGRDICTVWSVGPHEWVTAAHCTMIQDPDSDSGDEKHGGFYTIGGYVATLDQFDDAHDLAAFRVDAAVSNPLSLANDQPEVGDEVSLIGYPRMWNKNFPTRPPIVFKDRIAALRVETDCYGYDDRHDQMIFEGSGAPGNSGSPILKGSKVVSVLQCGFPQAIPTGAVWSDLVRFVRKLAR